MKKYSNNEPANMVERYAKRNNDGIASLYDPLRAEVNLMVQERERVLIRKVLGPHLAPLKDKCLLEIGCGNGANLSQLLQLGFRPENLVGNELLPNRVEEAKEVLPARAKIIAGDALEVDLGHEVFDAVLISTVFTSILDKEFQNHLADKVWSLVKPGGGVIWYDFIYNNPHNKDVRSVPLSRLHKLFSEAQIKSWKVTLAPPIARRVCSIHPSLYSIFNALPFLRTHVLAWIEKP